MKTKFKISIFCLMSLVLNSCVDQNLNLNNSGEDELKTLEIENPIDNEEINFRDIIYVPIYSDIYIDSNNPEFLLSATLSIRNTSFIDSLYISKIDYYNTQGDLVKSFIDKTIGIKPMETLNYVIEKEDKSGGAGANFIVEMNAKASNLNPLVQAVMIGHFNQWAFSFSTDGYSIKPSKAGR